MGSDKAQSQIETAAELGAKIAAAWVNTLLELEKLERVDRHVPEDNRTLAEDLENEVVKFTTFLWDTLRQSHNCLLYTSPSPRDS